MAGYVTAIFLPFVGFACGMVLRGRAYQNKNGGWITMLSMLTFILLLVAVTPN